MTLPCLLLTYLRCWPVTTALSSWIYRVDLDARLCSLSSGICYIILDIKPWVSLDYKQAGPVLSRSLLYSGNSDLGGFSQKQQLLQQLPQSWHSVPLKWMKECGWGWCLYLSPYRGNCTCINALHLSVHFLSILTRNSKISNWEFV